MNPSFPQSVPHELQIFTAPFSPGSTTPFLLMSIQSSSW